MHSVPKTSLILQADFSTKTDVNVKDFFILKEVSESFVLFGLCEETTRMKKENPSLSGTALRRKRVVKNSI